MAVKDDIFSVTVINFLSEAIDSRHQGLHSLLKLLTVAIQLSILFFKLGNITLSLKQLLLKEFLI